MDTRPASILGDCKNRIRTIYSEVHVDSAFFVLRVIHFGEFWEYKVEERGAGYRKYVQKSSEKKLVHPKLVARSS